MKSNSEELLYVLLWFADKLTRPTFRNLTDSYEGWAYRNGLLKEISELEKRQLIETRLNNSNERVCRLTSQGRLCALGGRDPEVCWSRNWDGRWRLIVFDIPVARDSYRRRLRRYLHDRGFGCLQGSVWVTPDPLEKERKLLVGTKADVASLLLLDAKTCAGESDAEIVASAWDFERINQCYMNLMKILESLPDGSRQGKASATALLRWASAEREAWLKAVILDPLLPERLLPSGYLGRAAWNRRIDTLRKARSRLQGRASA